MGVGEPGGWGEARAEVFDGDLGADVGAHAIFFGVQMEAGCAVETVAVEQRHRGHVRVEGRFDEAFGGGGAFEEAEGAGGVEFDVHKSSKQEVANRK